MDQLRTVKLYGEMGVRFGRVHRLAVGTPGEAVRALCATRPGFEKYLMESKDNGVGFAVFLGKKNLSEHELVQPIGGEDFRIAPMPFGAKNGITQIIAGVVLIVVGALIQIYVFDGEPNPISNYMYGAGINMIVGGIMQLLAPHPKGKSTGDKADLTPSYAFNGSVNTMAQGYPVPLLYGKMKSGSAVISAGIFAQDNFVTPSSDAGGALGSGGTGGAGNTLSPHTDVF
jgi:predicted phage tail protein